MENHAIKMAFIAVLALVNSCKSLEVTPTSELGYDEGISTSAGLEGVINTAFGRFISGNGAATYFDEILYAEAQSVKSVTRSPIAPTSGNTYELNLFNLQANSGVLGNLSRSRYASVTAANVVLDAIERNIPQDADIAIQKNRLMGEGYFCRGTAFFESVRFWGHQYGFNSTAPNSGIPIPLTVPVTGSIGVGRSTVEETYAQIITDLTKATQLLPVAYDASVHGAFPAYRFRSTRAAAFGILARVYFQQGTDASYQKSLEAINAILGPTPGTIAATVNTGTRVYALQPFHSGTTLAAGGPFNSTGFTSAPANSEEIIRLVNNTTTTGGYIAASANLTLESGGNPTNRGGVRWVLKRPTPDVAVTVPVTTSPLFDDVVNDRRFTVLTANNNFGTAAAPRNERYSLKWGSQTGTLIGFQTCPMLRAGELVITRAEINAVLNNLTAAAADYNLVRTRAGAVTKKLGDAGFTTKAEVLAEIVKERQRELLFEGDDYWAWKRMGAYNAKNAGVYPASEVAPFVRGGVSYNWNNNKTLLKFALDDINLNPLMGPGTQNPD
ncbi:MAG: RagB/SusD family nutrient uptake outer membrane protein [Bacteroidetes bacterium]|nr:RagB/SusD family nutrient uptake outer membrane protein [Fibrella sp.]